MNEAEMKKAFKAALEESGAIDALQSMESSLKASFPGRRETETAEEEVIRNAPSDSNDPTPAILDTTAAANQQSLLTGLTSAFKQGLVQIEKFASEMENLEKGINKFTKHADDFYDPVQKMFGGLQEGLGSITNETSKSVASNLAFVQDLFVQVGSDLGGLSGDLKTKLPTGEEVNILDRLYKSDKEARKEALRMLDQFTGQYQARYNEMSKTEVVHMQAYSKGLGLSTDKVAKIVKRQIQLTGQAGTESLQEIAAYSKQIESVTGISYKQIAHGVSEIITNVKTFGNVQAEEAARIAGTLQQLGVSYQSFGSMVDKFMSFESATAAIGDLTSVFGVHMDAMEMMQLANEDEEEFMHRMRDSFIDQGIAVEDLTKAQRNMLASTLQIDPSEVENFFDPDLMEASAEDMKAATDEADLAGAFQDMITNAEFSRKSLADLQKQADAKIFSKLRDQTFEMSQKFDGMKRAGAHATIALVGDAAEAASIGFAKMSTSIDMMSDKDKLIEQFANSSDAGLKQLAEDVKAGTKTAAQAVLIGYQENFDAIDTLVGAQAEKTKDSFTNLVAPSLDISAIGTKNKATAAAAMKPMTEQIDLYANSAALSYAENFNNTLSTAVFASPEVNVRANVEVASSMQARTDQIAAVQQTQVDVQRAQTDSINTNLENLSTSISSVVEAERNRPNEIFLNMKGNIDGKGIFEWIKDFKSEGDEVIVTSAIEAGN